MTESDSGGQFLLDRPTTGFVWRVLRTLALLWGILAVYLRPDLRDGLQALVGIALAYVALTFLIGPGTGASRFVQRVRTVLDLLLIAALATLDTASITPVRYLLLVPVLEAALLLDLENLAETTLLAAVAALALGLSAVTPANALIPEIGGLLGAIVSCGLVLAILVRDQTLHRQRDRRLQHLLRQQSAVDAIAATMRREVGFEELAATIVEASLELSSGLAATLAILNDAGDSLEPVATRSLGPAPPAAQIERIEAGQMLQRGQVMVVRALDGPGAIVQIPLIGEAERAIGRLTVRSPYPVDSIDRAEREALAAVGEQAGVAWETVWLRESLRKQTRDLTRSSGELSALVEVSRALVARDQHEVLDEILGKAIALMAAERGSLMLIDEEKDDLFIETARGLSENIVESTRVPLGEGFAGRVAKTGEPLRLVDTLDGAPRADVRDALCVPLRVQDRIIGVLNISNKTGPGVFSEGDLDFLSAMANQAAAAIQNARLVGDLQELFLSTISTLAKAVDAKDRYTAGHSHRVTLFALEIASELGFTSDELDLLRIAGLMHDVGKIGVPEQILRKPGPLTDEEREVMRQHPLFGARIVEPIKQLHPILPGVRWHHERYDGRGYPDGLGGDDIPRQAQVLMVADAYDAMTSDRPYRRGLPDETALAELRVGRGSQWHADAVEAFLAAHAVGRIEPIKGSMPES